MMMACNVDVAYCTGELISKPFLSEKMAVELLQRLYGLEAKHTKALPSFCDQNFYMRVAGAGVGAGPDSDADREFVLKLSNSGDSLHQAGCYEEIISVLLYLREREATYPVPIQNLHGGYLSLQTFYRGTDGSHGLFLVMLLSYLPGKILSEVNPLSNQLLFNVGRSLGSLDKHLLEYKGASESLKSRAAGNKYCLTSAAKVRQFLYREPDESRRVLANSVLDIFLRDVKPLEKDMQKGVIHVDANRDNILVMPVSIPTNQDVNRNDVSPATLQSAGHIVSGIIDFNDMAYECLVYDIAGSLVDMMIGRKDDDPLVAAGHFLAGYSSVIPLTTAEWQSVYFATATRLVQLLVLSYDEYCRRIGEPDEYIIRLVDAGGWDVLKKIWDTPQRKVEALWEGIVKDYQ